MRAKRSVGEMGLAPEVMGFSPVTFRAPSAARATLEVAATAVVAARAPSAARLVISVLKCAPIRPHITRSSIHPHVAILAVLDAVIAPEPAIGLAKLPTQRRQRRARRLRHTGLEPQQSVRRQSRRILSHGLR